MDKELKARLVEFIGSLDDQKIGDEALIKEAGALYKLLTRPPGRKKKED